MDKLANELQSFLVRLGRTPESVPHEKAHYTEHLLHLLSLEDEEDLMHYFGLFGEEQLSLREISHRRGQDEASMMERIDRNIRKLAVTPEWQVIKQGL